jgi:hypothetical protein
MTPSVRMIRGNGDTIYTANRDVPLNTFVSLETAVLNVNRDRLLIERTKEASFAVKTMAKHYRNLDRNRAMKILALQNEIFEGKLVSWGFGAAFDEYYGPIDSNNRPHGEKGLKIYSDGSTYVGSWFRGMRHHVEGKGAIWNRPDGTQYLGTYMNDLKHGKGKFTYPDGGSYSGEFAQGFEHGQGIRIYNDGSKYEGRFRYGKRDGQGILYFPNGKTEKRVFKDTEAFHEALVPEIEEEETEDPDKKISKWEPDSLLTLSVRAVAKAMKFKRNLLPNTLIYRRLQPFLKPMIAKEYLTILNPPGSELFAKEAPPLAFRESTEIKLNYVKFFSYDMESFLYFTSMSSSLVVLELVNNRLDPSSIDMINTQISKRIWPHLTCINFSLNKIDTTGVVNFLNAIKVGVNRIEIVKLSGCNINSTAAQSVGK